MYLFFKRVYVKIFKVIHLRTKKPAKGNVLLSYITYAFLRPKNTPESHTNYWECREIARTFLELGYNVDVIDWKNSSFIPRKKYAYFLDIYANMGRLSPLMSKDCIKIFHATGSHWLFQNHAEYERLIALQRRRGVSLLPRRNTPPSLAIENADTTLLLGNGTTESTYQYADKKITRIPLSTTHFFPYPDKKDINEAKKKFVWFGGGGMVHKGLDLVLEAFAEMPEYQLSICGNVKEEKDFEKAYWKELYKTPNIKTFGKVDPGGKIFHEIIESSVALVYPSCSEGQSGAVIACMHAGMIPAISRQSGVDVNDFGIVFQENTVEEIKKTVRTIASMTNKEIETRSKKAWEYARTHHTRERFTVAFQEFISAFEKKSQ
ncbi:glycosyltransferase family 1 protein [bacterium]|nr:MAG: glycosyltransferase family 1 protein [bacterium]